MEFFLSFYGNVLTPFFAVIYWILIVSISIRILLKRKPNSFVVAWILVIHLVPILGIFLYFLFGEVNIGHLIRRRTQSLSSRNKDFINELSDYPSIFSENVSPEAKPLFQLIKHQSKLGGVVGNQLILLENYQEIFQQLLQDIKESTSNIEMTFYIWQDGGFVDEIKQALFDAIKRGVRCKLMLDSAGSRSFLKSSQVQVMRDQGIEIVECLKVNLFRFMFRRLDLRQHRKMVIIDNHICYTGSMNMVDPRHFKQDEHVGEWVDVMVRMKGPITMMMGVLYAGDWLISTGKEIKFPKIDTFEADASQSKHIVQLLPSGPGYKENMLQQSLLTAIYAAQKELILTTPYFVPSDDILHAICTAADRGVDVKIILPKKGDSTMTNWASRAFFTELLESGVQLYQFNNNLLHTKSVLVDKTFCFVGTVNLDMRSLWLNFELTAIIDDIYFAADLNHLLDQYLAQSSLLTLDEWKKRPVWSPVVERLFYFFSPVL